MRRSYSLELLNLSCGHVTGRKEFIKDSRATGRRGGGGWSVRVTEASLSRDPDKEPTGSAPRFFHGILLHINLRPKSVGRP
ncbi:hypothetical protein CEXT_639131 [Caerostris extrusa]|uniref:Uncharacterized protein n=1 Tax=Caerostris extrusa TaxID=172846 RepID=A0AAV4WP45_CAEEX|nr:hypothetical protein CEXT_639131 [Caerostris extrusa]